MGLFKNLRGTLESFFNIGGPTGPALKDNAGVMQVRNFDDTAFARLQVAVPVADNDAVTKKYADTLEKPLIVAAQVDTSASVPSNTAVRRLLVVTTAGSGAAIGDLLFDDGSSGGTMEILAAVNGRTIAVLTALTGGTITFEADSINIWDADGSSGGVQWVKIGDIGSVTGAIRHIRLAIGTAATLDSATAIPANARILQCDVQVTTSYNGGASIQVGVAGGTVDLIQATGDNKPSAGGTPNTYSKEQDTDWGAATAAVRVTISASSGVGVVNVWYTNANG